MHIAAAYMSMEAVKFFADRYDGAPQKRTRRGSLPLHVAAACRATNGLDPTEVIRFLAMKYPPALEARDVIGGLPMHHAAKSSTVQAVEARADFWEPALQETANDGELPMHLAASNVHNLEQVVTLLADRYPQALQARDDSGRLPIHCAAEMNPSEGVQLLAKLSPLGLRQRDKAGFLPLEVAIYKGATADVVQTLLEAYPEAVHAITPRGLTVWHVAFACDAPSDVVRLLVKNCSSGWLVQFLVEEGISALQDKVILEVVQHFTTLVESGVPEEADALVEIGVITHLVQLQSSPIYEIKNLAVRAHIAGARASPRFRKALQEAQAARTLAAQQENANDRPEALNAAQKTSASSSEGGRSIPYNSTPLSDLHDEEEMVEAHSHLREVTTNDESEKVPESSPLLLTLNDKISPYAPLTGSLVAANHLGDFSPDKKQAEEPVELRSVNVEDEAPYDPDDDLEFALSIRRLLAVPTPPIELIVRRGILPRLVSFLQLDNNPVLQRETVWILSVVASGTFEHTAAIVESGAVPHLVRLLGSPRSDDVRENAAQALGDVAVDSPRHRDVVLRAGAIEPLLRLLLEADGNKSLIRKAVRAFSDVCSDGPDMDQVRPALPVWANLLHHPDHKVVEEACWAFSDLLCSCDDDDDDVVQEVIDADSSVSTRLVELVRSHCLRVQLAALCTVGNIVCGDRHQIDTILNLHVLPGIAGSLTSRKEQIRTEACRVVANIAASTVSHIQKVVENPSIVLILIKMLVDDTPGVKDEAGRAIGNALTGGSAEQVQILVDAGCVKPLCDFLPGLDDDDEAVAAAVDGMRRILYLGEIQSRANVGDGGGGASNNKHNLLAAKITEAGGLSKIQALQNHRNVDVREVSNAFVDEYFGSKG